MKLLNTFKDAASVEIAWYKALIQAQNDGFIFVVNVIAKPAGLQKHYFKSIKAANEFVTIAKENPKHWGNTSKPITIQAALKQCWS